MGLMSSSDDVGLGHQELWFPAAGNAKRNSWFGSFLECSLQTMSVLPICSWDHTPGNYPEERKQTFTQKPAHGGSQHTDKIRRPPNPAPSGRRRDEYCVLLPDAGYCSMLTEMSCQAVTRHEEDVSAIL